MINIFTDKDNIYNATVIKNASVPNSEEISETVFENLYPALIECFIIIFCGYLAGRCNLISSTEAKSLNIFVGTFSLPALIFSSMIGRRRMGTTENSNCCDFIFSVLKNVVLNPVVMMTALGIGGNFIFDHKLPVIFGGILKVFGQAFSATALFLLGLRMVGKVQSLRGSGLVIPGILIAVKTILLPLVSREIVSLLKPGNTANETLDYSNYAFLYGTFPTAPGVFVFATQYNVAVDLVASTMVACTFLSAPLMFISAKMVTLVKINPFDYAVELEAVLYNVSIIGLICTVWVIIVFLLTKKWKKTPHFVTFCLTLSQCTACIGALMWSLVRCNHSWKLYVQFFLFTWGVFSSRFWTALLAFTMLLLHWKSCKFIFRIRYLLAVLGWGVPAVIVILLATLSQRETDLGSKHDPNFQYGITEVIVALLLLWFSLFTSVVCLILHQRYEKHFAQYESMLNFGEQDGTNEFISCDAGHSLSESTSVGNGNCIDIEDRSYDKIFESTKEINISENDSIVAKGDRHVLESQEGDDLSVNSSSDFLLQENGHQINNDLSDCIVVRDKNEELQTSRHLVLLLFLCGSMTVGFALCSWSLVIEEVNGVYVELMFLDIVLNFGQGVFTAAIFGLDFKLIAFPILQLYRNLVYGHGKICLPRKDKLDPLTVQTCEQFTQYHIENCIREIVKDRRWRLKELKAVFGGNEMVDWLLKIGLARDRIEAVKYGRSLLEGRVIQHIDGSHHFHDQPLFYMFKEKDI